MDLHNLQFTTADAYYFPLKSGIRLSLFMQFEEAVSLSLKVILRPMVSW
jgi:hypothetical protein